MLINKLSNINKGPGPPGSTCISITSYFHDKTKISKENIQVDYYLLLKYYRRQCILLLPTRPNHLQNLTPKCEILNLFWT